MRLSTAFVCGGAAALLFGVVACSALLDASSLTDGARGGEGGASFAGASAGNAHGGSLPSAGANALAGSDTGALGGTTDNGGGSEAGGTSGAVASHGGQGTSGGTVGVAGGAAGGGSGGSEAGAATGGDAGEGGGGPVCQPSGTVEYCDGVDNDCNPATKDVCPAGCVGAVFQGVSYMACSNELSFDASEASCVAQKMHLVKIDDAAENTFVASLIKPLSQYVWIGGSDELKSRTFKWRDGTTLYTAGAPVAGVYTNFSNNEPASLGGADCLQITRGPSPPSGYWSDAKCSDSQPFACERF